ncbi:Squamosa promoter-binding protein [Thalictrum thalictroides]|uniref:Squamosa promoter-binding protein n=1 Tax=Thalictrum thalictroides TaxID=46969 RepID=A0A7J6X0P8_THATH|nr:Squamosa promoter-binding protein [Thalictrum thalictroides]
MPNNKRCHSSSQQKLLLHTTTSNWNPNIWDWDTINFVAKPKPSPHPNTQPLLNPLPLDQQNDQHNNLELNLGGRGRFNTTTTTTAHHPSSAQTPSKRLRSQSLTTTTYPMCQVDDCRINLSNAKDYQRRHKVCQLHSKTTKSLVRNQMQRFCQQCSRFHPLLEFDDRKRSCRRRLAGHNRRRRKSQPEDVSSQLLIPKIQENTGNSKLDVLNLLTTLARLQKESNAQKTTNGVCSPDIDRVIQIPGKINSLAIASNSTSRFPSTGGFDLNVVEHDPLEDPDFLNGNTSASSTTDSLAVPSTALVVSRPDALTALSQRSRKDNDDAKINVDCPDQEAGFSLQKRATPCNTQFQEASNTQFQEAWPTFPLQLFSSSPEGESPLKLDSSRNYYSSGSSDPMEESSPSSSPPVVRRLFPLQAELENIKHGCVSVSGGENGKIATSAANVWNSSYELHNSSSPKADNRLICNLTSKPRYTSSSGSDYSPSSSNSGFQAILMSLHPIPLLPVFLIFVLLASSLLLCGFVVTLYMLKSVPLQDQTGRIIFKLFDKDPSDLPAMLKTQIYNWLAKSPSDMESFIRPGCVILSIFIAMPVTTWVQLQKDLMRYVQSLVQDSVSDIWRNGDFLVQMDRQLASHRSGNIRVCKAWRTLSTPELLSVSPLAVVCGQDTSLVLRGRKLTIPGTKIYCTYMGKYMSKKVIGSPDTVYEDTSIQSFDFVCGSPCVQGRCFIEVENGLKGNSFPIIIADAYICGELRHLESELDNGARADDIVLEDEIQHFRQPKSREDALHFLNELGWLFQRNSPSRSYGLYFSLTRFRFLLLFSVERDWCALVKTLIDIYVESNVGEDGLSKESQDTLDGIHLLNRAVKRKCVNMINLLIQYTHACQSGSLKYLFPPNKADHEGVTPLHLAACTRDAEHMVDALTNGAQEFGLACWTSQRDANGRSPYVCALMRNNHCYNKLVARKLADLKCPQVSVSVGDSISLNDSFILVEQADGPSSQSLRGQRSCARCSSVMTRHYKMPGTRGLFHRPYVHSMLTIAAVCVCVCLFLRGSPDIGHVAPFKWENVHFGTI